MAAPEPPGGPASALPVPRSEAGRAGLAALLAAPRRSLVGLDFDGTLAPIVADPARARALPGAIAVLRDLSALAGTVAIITGRPALEAVEFARLESVPGVIVLGHYGRQSWTGGRLTAPPPPPGLAEARTELPALLAAAGAAEGTWIEDKGDALAVHTRRAADPQQALDRISGPLTQLAARTGLAAEPGRYVLELRPPGSDKGKALKRLAAERGPAAAMFCGDDLGDRPAFQAIRELRDEGIPGLTVCSGSAEVPALAQEADLLVDGPDGVVTLLNSLAAGMSAAAGVS
ncbi:MAG: trehalose-phosphatase [Streptosporangiaceae bacterium]|jgi:trehalose 6-phosphate phosphatase|nr:trehalose-phosphatase [Actinomycetota bacterium]